MCSGGKLGQQNFQKNVASIFFCNPVPEQCLEAIVKPHTIKEKNEMVLILKCGLFSINRI